MKSINYLMGLLLLLVIGCSKDNEEPIHKEFQEKKIKEIIPANYLKVLKDMGMTVHEGTDPPDISGFYFGSPLRLVQTNIENDYVIGYEFHFTRYSFSEFDQEDFTLQVLTKQGNLISESKVSVISGSDKSFTVYSMMETTYGTHSVVLAYLYSGIMDGGNIKDFSEALIVVENKTEGSGFLKEGQARVIEDGDFITERIGSMDDLPGEGKIPADKFPSMGLFYFKDLE